MSEIENKAGLILAAIVIFIFLMVVAFIKRTHQAKADDEKKENIDNSGEYKN